MRDDDGRVVIENYLLQVGGNLPRQVAREVIPELRSHLVEEATTNNRLSTQGARRAVSRMGEPRTIAEEYSREFNTELRENKVEEVEYTGAGSNVGTRQNSLAQTVPNRGHYGHPFDWIGEPVKWMGRLVKWTGSLVVKLILFGLLIGAVVSLVASIVGFLLPFPYYRPYILLGGLVSSLTLFALYYVLKTSIYGKPKFVEGTSRSYEGQRVSTNGYPSEPATSSKSERNAATAFPVDDMANASYSRATDQVAAEQRSHQVTETPAANYCPYCGKALTSDASFCPNCGASIREEDGLNVNTNLANQREREINSRGVVG